MTDYVDVIWVPIPNVLLNYKNKYTVLNLSVIPSLLLLLYYSCDADKKSNHI
jgi:hypothetical protein